MSDEIAVCCGTPLVWTFMFSGAEWYCRKCKAQIPMLNVERIDSTPDMVKEKAENADWFFEIAKDCIPLGSRRRGCEKCNSENHLDHATPKELALSIVAYGKLARETT